MLQFLWLLHVYSQAPSGAAPDIPRSGGSTSLSSLPCVNATNQLVAQASSCLRSYYAGVPNSKTTSLADTLAQNFITCICATSWVAGNDLVVTASVPSCPAPSPMSKGDMAKAVTACASPANSTERLSIIQAFHLNVTTNSGIYVPLSGLPPGVTSSSAQHLPLFCLLLLIIFSQ